MFLLINLCLGSTECKVFAQPIHANILPAIDYFLPEGHCFEEVKMVQETRKILAAPSLLLRATTVRVPVLRGHSEAVAVKLSRKVTRQELINCFRNAGDVIKLVEEDEHMSLPTPVKVVNEKQVYISRVRLPYGEEQASWVQFFVIADNLKKGAATNAVQILETLAR